jgi:hypothetical protein
MMFLIFGGIDKVSRGGWKDFFCEAETFAAALRIGGAQMFDLSSTPQWTWFHVVDWGAQCIVYDSTTSVVVKERFPHRKAFEDALSKQNWSTDIILLLRHVSWAKIKSHIDNDMDLPEAIRPLIQEAKKFEEWLNDACKRVQVEQ